MFLTASVLISRAGFSKLVIWGEPQFRTQTSAWSIIIHRQQKQKTEQNTGNTEDADQPRISNSLCATWRAAGPRMKCRDHASAYTNVPEGEISALRTITISDLQCN